MKRPLFTGNPQADRETLTKLLEILAETKDLYGPEDRALSLGEKIEWIHGKFREVEEKAMR